jgi:hypothetical protein
MMNKLFLLVAFFLIACGGEESVEKCLGLAGAFEGKPNLSVNNCSNPVYGYGMTTLVVDENSHFRKCGEHILEYSIVDDSITKCRIYYTKSVLTSFSGYVGRIKGEMDCSMAEPSGGKCLSFWEINFEKIE